MWRNGSYYMYCTLDSTYSTYEVVVARYFRLAEDRARTRQSLKCTRKLVDSNFFLLPDFQKTVSKAARLPLVCNKYLSIRDNSWGLESLKFSGTQTLIHAMNTKSLSIDFETCAPPGQLPVCLASP